MSVAGTCSSCIYWDPLPTVPGKGRCRYDPPRDVISQSWLVTNDVDWCGQFLSSPPPALMPVVSGVANAPAGTNSVVELMQGLGLIAGFSVTPVRTGRVACVIAGCCANDSANGGLTITGRYGTGAAPANGAAVTGQIWSITQGFFMTSAKDVSGFSSVGGHPALALNVPVWFDLSIAATGGGNATLTDVQSLLWEL